MAQPKFGSDLGLVHEAVVTGRKVGFGRAEWTRLSESETLARAVVNLIRRNDAVLPRVMPDKEKIGRLAKLLYLIVPFAEEGHFCIDCEANRGKGAEIGPRLLASYEELGLVLSPGERKAVQTGHCHQPVCVAGRLIEETLGVEWSDGTSISSLERNGSSSLLLGCQLTTVTSIPNLYALIEACEVEELELDIDLRFRKEAE